jgi:hypothetical protein
MSGIMNGYVSGAGRRGEKRGGEPLNYLITTPQ